ncbi:MAG: metallophosphoesterase family protein [Desulfatibacillum sp.]|nr:metallophosphoesterase family protein [Desulfatibacillum sp.]
MRIALISDIHGNDIALKTVLQDIEHAGGIDQVVCLGDVATLGPDPCAVVKRLREIKCPCVLGNHDAFLFDPDLIHQYTEVDYIIEAVDWCREQLSREEIDWMGEFHQVLEVILSDETSLLAFHGSPLSHMDNILARTPDAEIDRMIQGLEGKIMACGHTHIQMVRQHRGGLIVNPGSVGLPFREFLVRNTPQLLDHAEYAIISEENGCLSVEARRVSLDRKAMFEAAKASANPMRYWLMDEYS